MPLTTVNPGNPLKIPADTYNAFVNAATHHQTRSGGGPPEPRKQTNKLIDIRNKSGGDVGRGAVLGVGSPAILPDDVEDEFFNSLVIDGVAPTADHVGNGHFVVVAEPLTNDAVGKGYASGAFPCVIEMNSADDTRADVEDGNADNFVSGTGPIDILWVDSSSALGGDPGGTGLQAAIGRLDEAVSFLAVIKAAGSADGKHQAQVLQWEGGTLVERGKLFGGPGQGDPPEVIDPLEKDRLATGSLVRIVKMMDQWVAEPVNFGEAFPVDLTQTGGSAGNTTTQTTFTYTVNDLSGNTLATGVDPTSSPHRCARESLGPHVAATHGLASYLPSSTGPTLALVHTNEVLDTGVCPP